MKPTALRNGNNESIQLLCSIIFKSLFLLIRGESFRSVLLRVGELRSLLPSGVNMMALTATATSKLQKKVSSLLGMRSPICTYLSPCKSNIVYKLETFHSIEVNFTALLNLICEERANTPRTVIYCRRFNDCSNLYMFF